MKTCLFTGFKPFLNYPTNPTEELASKLHSQTLGDYQIFSRILPVDYERSMASLGEIGNFDLVLLNGLAFERKTISLETRAYNQIESSKPDNQGLIKEKQKIQDSGEDVLLSSFPLFLLNQIVQSFGDKIRPSSDPGRYLCNFIYYQTLSLLYNSSTPAPCLFIHWPADKTLDQNSPYDLGDYQKIMSDFFNLLMLRP